MGDRFGSTLFGEGERLWGVGGGDAKPNSNASSNFRSSMLRTVGSFRYFDRRRSWVPGELLCVVDTRPRQPEDRLSEATGAGVDATLRRDNFRRKVLTVSDRVGVEGERGGERGWISTDNVGVNEIGEKSGAQSILPILD